MGASVAYVIPDANAIKMLLDFDFLIMYHAVSLPEHNY